MQIGHKALIYNNKERLEAFQRLTTVHSCYFIVFYLLMFYLVMLSLARAIWRRIKVG
jgi:hypothetical protein